MTHAAAHTQVLLFCRGKTEFSPTHKNKPAGEKPADGAHSCCSWGLALPLCCGSWSMRDCWVTNIPLDGKEWPEMFRRGQVGASAESNSTETRISLSGWMILEENIHVFSKIIRVLPKNNFFSGRKYHCYLVLVCLAENLPSFTSSSFTMYKQLKLLRRLWKVEQQVCAQNCDRVSHCHQHSEPGRLLWYHTGAQNWHSQVSAGKAADHSKFKPCRDLKIVMSLLLPVLVSVQAQCEALVWAVQSCKHSPVPRGPKEVLQPFWFSWYPHELQLWPDNQFFKKVIDNKH